ncbi:hypothetical protein HQ563_13440 [bacterium]|nr:hypothetical protein [bacterium]
MNRRFLISLGGMCVLAFCCVCRADSWANPTPRMFASDDGHWALRVIPETASRGKADTIARGILFEITEDGTDRILWEKPLVNIPVRALLFKSYDKLFVVTLDTWARMGYEHSLVIYDREGKVVRDLRPEDFLTKKEIRGRVDISLSSRHWRKKADFTFVHDQKSPKLRITFNWGKVLEIELPTGEIAEQHNDNEQK